MSGSKKVVDWELIERHYRAGIKTLRQIADENGISEGAIRKRAKRDIWTRSLEDRIQARAAEKVRKELVRTPGTQLTPDTEKRTVEAYSTVVAGVDLVQREDVQLAMANARGMLCELVDLANPEFKEILQWMALNFDDSSDTYRDKAAEAYKYIVSLVGRVKMAKELAAVHGVYIPIQRKVFKLDGDEKSNVSAYEDMLRAVGAG